MDGLNQVTLIGNLGADPVLNETERAIVLRFNLATSTSWMDDGERRERTDWHTVVIFGARAKGLAKILRQGSRVGIVGELRTNKWTDKEGVDRWTTQIYAQDVILCGEPRRGT